MRAKSFLASWLLSALALPALSQAPPGAPAAAADSTNAPAAPAPAAATNAPAAANVPTINTNQLEAIRRQLQQAITNRVSRAATNRAAFPLPPGVAANTNVAAAATLPLPVTATVAPAGGAAAPGVPPPGIAAEPFRMEETGITPRTERAEHILKFNNAPPDQIFEKYSELTGRTVLRPAALPVAAVTIITYSPLTREEAVHAIDGALALNNITMIPQGEKFVKAVPSAQALPEGAAISHKKSGELPDAEQFLTHVVQLKTVKPSEVAQLFTSFTKNPGGIVPIDSSQILVIRDYASSIKRMLELIEKVDVPPESDYRLEVIPIRYGKVTDLFSTMNALISGAGGGGVGSTTPTAQRRGGQLGTPSMPGGAPGRYGTQTSRFGQPGGVQQQQLAGAQPAATPGTSFQNRLNQIVSRAAGESQIQVLGDARIVPDERSNSLIVFANKQDIQMITNIVSKVDVLLAQVLIEGIVISVSMDDSENVGVSWLQKQKQFSQNFTGAGGINNGQSFFGNLTNFSSSLPSGFSYFGKLGNDFEVALQALSSAGRGRILQRPRLQTSHAVPGVFFNGRTVPYVSGFYDYGGFGSGISTRGNVDLLQVGVSLSVTPFITPDGLVVLDVTQDISSLESFVDVSQGQKAPQTATRSASATLSVRDGETIMLGGYVDDNRTSNKSGVPVLKDIPLLGALFRSKSHDNKRSELILLLKVTVLKDPAQASAQAEAEKSKLPGVSAAEKEFRKTEEKGLKK